MAKQKVSKAKFFATLQKYPNGITYADLEQIFKCKRDRLYTYVMFGSKAGLIEKSKIDGEIILRPSRQLQVDDKEIILSKPPITRLSEIDQLKQEGKLLRERLHFVEERILTLFFEDK